MWHLGAAWAAAWPPAALVAPPALTAPQQPKGRVKQPPGRRAGWTVGTLRLRTRMRRRVCAPRMCAWLGLRLGSGLGLGLGLGLG